MFYGGEWWKEALRALHIRTRREEEELLIGMFAKEGEAFSFSWFAPRGGVGARGGLFWWCWEFY